VIQSSLSTDFVNIKKNKKPTNEPRWDKLFNFFSTDPDGGVITVEVYNEGTFVFLISVLIL
jgi:hypothetical protein